MVIGFLEVVATLHPIRLAEQCGESPAWECADVRAA